MKRLIALGCIVSLLHISLIAYTGPDKILARCGTHVLTQSDMDQYYEILSFMIEQKLEISEEQEIAEEVIRAFQEFPKQIEAEAWALTETLRVLQTDPSPSQVVDIRNTLFETLIEYEQKGNKSAFINIARRHKPEKFLAQK